MRIIEKIEIKHFRSLDGGISQKRVEIVDLRDLNIFSGANDSGKSNILRALNLFFNNEIVSGVPFDLDRDLSKLQKSRSDEKAQKKRSIGHKDVRQRDLEVKIKIHFIRSEGEGVLPEKFWVEKTWDKRGLTAKRNSNIRKNPDDNKARAQEGQLTQFLNRISFEYIPAVKDRQYFNYLFQRLQTYLFNKQDKKKNQFLEYSQSFNKTLKSETQKLFEEFKSNTGIEANFSIPDTLVDFFRTLSVETENGVSLFDRGDGVQARFIPDILNEIAKDSRKKIIWGFEEPENSYEPLKCFELSRDFVKYSTEKQIFITTHSFPFIALKGNEISSYRVKNAESVSKIGRIDWNQRTIKGIGLEDYGDELERELGILETYASLSEHLGIELEKPYVYVEGKWDRVYLEKAWEILNPNLCIPFTLCDKGGQRIINSLEDVVKSSGNKKLIALFDQDKAGIKYFDLKENNINEFFNIDESDRLIKKHKHKDVYVLLLDAPPHRENWVHPQYDKILEMEHLFEDSFIQSLGLKIPPGVTRTSKEWRATDHFKASLGAKIFNYQGDKNSKVVFKHFKPLLEKILRLLNLSNLISKDS